MTIFKSENNKPSKGRPRSRPTARSSPKKFRRSQPWFPKLPGIYMLKNLTTGDAYVGQSVDIGRRYKQHMGSLLGGLYGYTKEHHNSYLKARFYTEDVSEWAFIILELLPKDCKKEDLLKREKHYILLHGNLNVRGRTKSTRATNSELEVDPRPLVVD